MGRRSMRWALMCGLALLMCGLRVSLAEEPYELIADVEYARPGGESLAADIYVPKQSGPLPAVLVVHGGAWMMGHRTQLRSVAKELVLEGYTAVAISYRLAPRHPFPAQIEDCRTAVRWMRRHAEKYKIDPDRIAGYGYSAGGHLVSLLGTAGDEEQQDDDGKEKKEGEAEDRQRISSRLQAVVAGGAPCDFRVIPGSNRRLAYWLGGTRNEKPEAYRTASPSVFVSADDPPMFFFHGENDRLVPMLSPVAMQVLLKLSGVEAQVYTVPKAGHLAAVWDKSARAKAIEFLNRQLKPKPKAKAKPAAAASAPPDKS